MLDQNTAPIKLFATLKNTVFRHFWSYIGVERQRHILLIGLWFSFDSKKVVVKKIHKNKRSIFLSFWRFLQIFLSILRIEPIYPTNNRCLDRDTFDSAIV